MKRDIILIGGGGHCKACIDVIEREGRYRIAGIVDKEEKMNSSVLGYRIFATDQDLDRLIKKHSAFFITIGHIKNYMRRKQIFTMLTRKGVDIPSIISPSAYVSKHAKIGRGSIVMHRAFINADAAIGSNCIINTGSIIEHDCIIGDHCHISTGSIVNGECRIGEGTFVGSNCVISNGIKVKWHSVIGAGSIVVKTITGTGVYVGNPARKIR